MMKPFLIILLSFFMITVFCQEKKGLSVTFKNATDDDFKELHVNIRGTKYDFTYLKKGQSTRPIIVKDSYRYCYAKAITARDTIVCQPEDFVGETLLTQGNLVMKFEIIMLQNGKRFLIIK